MGGCCYSCLKFLVVIFNLIYMLLGLLLLATTLWIFLDETMLKSVANDMEGYNHVIYFFMAVAAVMTIMGFLGCCGALQESQCMLATFFALVLVLFVGQVAAGGWLFQHHDQFQEMVEKSVARSIQHDYGINEVKTKAFDVMQTELKCCGSSGPHDWAESRYNDVDNKNTIEVGVGKIIGNYKVPKSCCRNDIADGTCETSRQITLIAGLTNTIYENGCATKMIEVIERHDYVALAVVLAILLTEVMAMVFSMVLCCAVRRIDHFKA